MFRSESGQSLVEVALTLPVLLLILIGLADFGRAFHYSIQISDAAREAASYAARTVGVTEAQVRQVACDELGLVDYGDPCPAAVDADYAETGGGWDHFVTVTVSYRIELMSGYLVGRVVDTRALTLRSTAQFPVLK